MVDTKIDEAAITTAIQKAEQFTQGQIVVVIAEESGDYRAVSLGISIGLSVFLTSLVALFSEIQSYAQLGFLQLAIMLIVDLLLMEFGLVMQFVPRKMQVSAASRNAKAQFVQWGLHTTTSRAAIIIFISKKEKYIELIPDAGIAAKESENTWTQLTQDFSNLMHDQKDLQVALMPTINSCGDMLKKHFPSTDAPINELSDYIIKVD